MKKRKEEKPRAIVLISDTHVGSTCAICPPGFRTHENTEIGLNPLQKWYWDVWEAFWAHVRDYLDGAPFILVVNGDATEGDHHRTTEIWSKSNTDHMMAAKQLLEPVSQAAHSTYIVEGTECHTLNMEHALANELGAERNPRTRKPAWDKLEITVAGCRCMFHHHIGVTSRKHLQATQSSIQLTDNQSRKARLGRRIPQVLCCAHRHEPSLFTDWWGMTLITPAWQALTRHGNKFVPGAEITTGGYILDWRNRDDAELPHVEAFMRATPEPEEVVI